MDKEKVFISRDETDNMVWVWRRPSKNVWAPVRVKDCEVVNYQRENRSLENTDYYTFKNFKKKFGISIRKNSKQCCHLPVNLLNNEDYKLSSNDPDRKK